MIFLSTTGDVLNDTQQAAFERFIRAGGGYAGIHSAADTEYGWPWYGQLVGAYFRNHPNGTPTATIVVEDTTDPSTAGIPARWTRSDEWYNYQSPVNPVVNGGGNDYSPRNTAGVHVLLTMDESTYAEADGTDASTTTIRSPGASATTAAARGTRASPTREASFTDADDARPPAAGIEITAGVTPSAAAAGAAANQNPTVAARARRRRRRPATAIGSRPGTTRTATADYAWDFGDGGTSTGRPGAPSPRRHVRAKVTVSDGGRHGTATLTSWSPRPTAHRR